MRSIFDGYRAGTTSDAEHEDAALAVGAVGNPFLDEGGTVLLEPSAHLSGLSVPGCNDEPARELGKSSLLVIRNSTKSSEGAPPGLSILYLKTAE
jgi:hypothetical protein